MWYEEGDSCIGDLDIVHILHGRVVMLDLVLMIVDVVRKNVEDIESAIDVGIRE